jgi:hypothetical protein
MVNVPMTLAVIVGVIGVIGSVAAAVAVSRQYAIKASLESIIVANKELREDNVHLRQRLADAEKVTANLEGKLEVFTSHFAEQIVTAVVETVQRTAALVGTDSRTTTTHTHAQTAAVVP